LWFPPPTLAQRPAKIGILAFRHSPPSLEKDPYWQVVAGLRERGYVEGRNLSVEWRFAGLDPARLDAMAAELVRLGVDVIVALDGTPPTIAAQKATKNIPIVFVSVLDPVGSGLVKTLAHPGGNTTGLSNLAGDTTSKQLEFMGMVSATGAPVAILWNPANPASSIFVENVRAAAGRKGRALLPVGARSAGDIEAAIRAAVDEHAGALVVAADTLFTQEKAAIARDAAAFRLPSIGQLRGYPEAGGLMSYGANLADLSRRAAGYVDKILKGAKPADLPVEQPTKLDLVINKRTAETLGLTIPPELLVQADKVIE
jgi:putative ABC transport system substrate-binding protein